MRLNKFFDQSNNFFDERLHLAQLRYRQSHFC